MQWEVFAETFSEFTLYYQDGDEPPDCLIDFFSGYEICGTKDVDFLYLSDNTQLPITVNFQYLVVTESFLSFEKEQLLSGYAMYPYEGFRVYNHCKPLPSTDGAWYSFFHPDGQLFHIYPEDPQYYQIHFLLPMRAIKFIPKTEPSIRFVDNYQLLAIGEQYYISTTIMDSNYSGNGSDGSDSSDPLSIPRNNVIRLRSCDLQIWILTPRSANEFELDDSHGNVFYGSYLGDKQIQVNFCYGTGERRDFVATYDHHTRKFYWSNGKVWDELGREAIIQNVQLSESTLLKTYEDAVASAMARVNNPNALFEDLTLTDIEHPTLAAFAEQLRSYSRREDLTPILGNLNKIADDLKAFITLMLPTE